MARSVTEEVEFASLYLDVDGIRTHYLEAGELNIASDARCHKLGLFQPEVVRWRAQRAVLRGSCLRCATRPGAR